MHLADTPFLDSLTRAYLKHLLPAGTGWPIQPSIEAAAQAAETLAQFPAHHRDTLAHVLASQNAKPSAKQASHLAAAAKENVRYVVTGHQLCLFTGPLYVVFKALTTIKLAGQLQAAMPQYHFVPLFWLATEDHDLAEIQTLTAYGRQWTWPTTQAGPVGRMRTEGIAQVLETFADLPQAWVDCYAQSDTLAEGQAKLMQLLFGAYGLLTLDADSPELKRLFLPYFKQELAGTLSQEAVALQGQRLEDAGFKVPLAGRNPNLFYLKDDQRLRLEWQGNSLVTIDGPYQWTKAEAQAAIEDNPEQFSPNVVLRPLYQQVIVPAVAYIGGPGELAYWQQLASVFEAAAVPHPLVWPRFHATLLTFAMRQKLQKLALTPEQLMIAPEQLKKQLAAQWGADFSLSTEKDKLNLLLNGVHQRALAEDPTLKGTVIGTTQQMLEALDKVEKRVRKSQEARVEQQLTQALNLQAKLFPNGSLQERVENIYAFGDVAQVIAQLYQGMDATTFDFQFIDL